MLSLTYFCVVDSKEAVHIFVITKTRTNDMADGENTKSSATAAFFKENKTANSPPSGTAATDNNLQ